MKIVAPLPPNIANARMHWAVKLREKKAYWALCEKWMYAKRIPELEILHVPPSPAVVTVTLYLHSPMDGDNAVARLKWLMDWLVAYGYLEGDSRKHITWAGLPEQVIDRKNPRVELTIEALTQSEAA